MKLFLASYLVADLLVATVEGGRVHSSSAALQEKIISKATFVGGRNLGNNNKYVYASTGEWEAANNFQLTNYSMSYHRCAAVQQFDNEVASREDTPSVFGTKNFAIFRFCPSETCGEAMITEAVEGQQAAQGQVYYGAEQPVETVVYSNPKGVGCQENYGEYMIELEDYLVIMKEYQEGVDGEYCGFCENYMYTLYQQYVKQNSGRDRVLKYEEFMNDEDSQRELSNYNNGNQNYGVCNNYKNTCQSSNKYSNNNNNYNYYNKDAEDYVDPTMKRYIKCSEAGGVYVGPHCAEDGYNITLGVYADADCYVYLGNDVVPYIEADDLANYLNDNGNGLADGALKSWYNSKHGDLSFMFEGEEDSMCIPCEKTMYYNLYGELSAAANGEVFVDNTGEGIDEFCQALYESSARCHQYSKFSANELQKKDMQAMQLSCSYIDSVKSGNYDEMGYVNLKANWNYNEYLAPEWLRTNPYIEAVARVSPLQIFGLIFSVSAFIGLAAYSKTLHTSLVKREEWATQSRRPWPSIFRGPSMNRIDSGIDIIRQPTDGTPYYMS